MTGVPTLLMANVLVVEDHADLREMLTVLLESEGYTVQAARNGAEALEALAELRPDVILLDLMMPVMDGFEFLEEVEQRQGLEDVPIVVLTAKQLTAEEIDLLTGRTERVIAKEATSNVELGAAIRKCLRRRGTAATPGTAEA